MSFDLNSTRASELRKHLLFRRVLLSEIMKLWSLKSIKVLWILLLAVPLVFGGVRLLIFLESGQLDQASIFATLFESIAISGLPLGFIAAFIGIVSMGSEYASNSLVTTYLAVPRRNYVLFAKLLSVFLASFFGAFIGQASVSIFSFAMLSPHINNQPVFSMILEIIFFGSIGIALLGTLGLFFAVISKSPVSATLQLAGIFAVLPALLGALGGSAITWLTSLFPTSALQAIITRYPATAFTIEGVPPSSLTWIFALMVLAAWSFTYLLVGLIRVKNQQSLRLTKETSRSYKKLSKPIEGNVPIGLTVAGVFRSEVIKLVFLPATRWIVGLALMANVGLAILVAAPVNKDEVSGQLHLVDDFNNFTIAHQSGVVAAGIGVAQLLFAFLGAIYITTEFDSGNIRSSLLAVPDRAKLFTIKVVFLVLFVFGISSFINLITLLIASLVEQSTGFDISIGMSASIKTAWLSTLVVAIGALIGAGIGFLQRSTLASVLFLLGIFIVAPTALISMQIPAMYTPLVWVANLGVLFPTVPARAVSWVPEGSVFPQFLEGGVLQINPSQAMLIFFIWALGSLVVGWLVFRKRSF